MHKLLILVLAAVASAPAAFPRMDAAHAQTASRARVPAWVAISPELDATAPFRLARFAGSAPHDVILLARHADATTLTQAVEALLAARRAGGNIPVSDSLLRVRQQARDARVLPWAGRVLADVRAAEPRQLPGVGRMRAVRIWLPMQQQGGATPSGGR